MHCSIPILTKSTSVRALIIEAAIVRFHRHRELGLQLKTWAYASVQDAVRRLLAKPPHSHLDEIRWLEPSQTCVPDPSWL